MMSENESDDVRVLIVDDQRLIREGIASLLNIQDGVVVIGTAENGEEAVEKTQALLLLPQVILMDVRMPGMGGVEATRQIGQLLPECQILMLTTFDDEEYIVQSLHAGACGYLLKDIPAQDLAQAIRLAHAGIYQLAPEVAGKLVGSLLSGQQEQKSTSLPPPKHPLTDRELDVLRLIAKGATNREIAEQFVVSEGTVKNHVSNILNRLGLRDRTQAAIYAIENQLL